MIKNIVCPIIEFESEQNQKFSMDAIDLNHLYGEAQQDARAAEGIKDNTLPKSITTYDMFRVKLNNHFQVSSDFPSISFNKAVVFAIAAEMQTALDNLKKNATA